MKKTIKLLSFFMAFALVTVLQSCDEEDPTTDNTTGALVELNADNILQNLQLDASKKYLLVGKVYVPSGSTLNIPAGTVIFGDKETDGTLVINRGAKINAIGTETSPIVMTSEAPVGFRNRGDWGGVVILGRAYNSNGVSATIEGITATGENGVYGPGDAPAAEADDSGTMRYVRIEYAGIALNPDNELNSLTMGSVGSATDIDNIMVSYANDDAYEWFGGSVNHKYLIAFSTNDDDFDTDRGYNGKVQFGLVVRENQVADISGSRAWESSSNNNATAPTVGGVSRHSAPTFANITVLGPYAFGSAGVTDADYRAALEINSNSAIRVYNSIIVGFPVSANFATAGATVQGNVFAANNNVNTPTTPQAPTGGANVPATFATDNVLEASVANIFGAFTTKNPTSATNNNAYLLDNIKTTGAFQVAASPYLTGAVNVNDQFFTTVTHRGAFGSSAGAGWNWTSGWVEFSPNEKQY